MDRKTLLVPNALDHRKFSQDCHRLSARIKRLQATNLRLSDQLDALINKNLLFIERIKDALGR